MVNKAQYKTEKRKLNSEFYDTQLKRLGVRNATEKQRLETANIRLETAKEITGQASDRLKTTQAMTFLLQEHHAKRLELASASNQKLKAQVQDVLEETAHLFGTSSDNNSLSGN